MKIAYCISGFARVYRDTLPLLKKNVINILSAKHQVDIFISTWEKTDRGGYEEWHTEPYFEIQNVLKFPFEMSVEKNFECKNRYVTDFYKRDDSFLMAMDSEWDSFLYDVIFRDRFDTVHLRPFPLIELERSIRENSILIPRYVNDHGKSPLQDWCAFGPRDAMKNYFEVYDIIEDLPAKENLEQKLDFHGAKINDPEWVLYAGLKKLNQKWDWSSYEVTPYDRHFGNKVHERYTHLNEKGEEYQLPTKTY